jgi:hypothetical protein
VARISLNIEKPVFPLYSEKIQTLREMFLEHLS